LDKKERAVKPKYIFFAVIAVSILLIGLLPRLGHSPHITSAQAVQPPALPIVTISPSAEPEIASDSAAQETPQADPTAFSAQDQPVESQPTQPPPTPAPAAGAQAADNSDPDLASFIASVQTGQPQKVAGVYAPGIFGMPVTGQPGDDETYVSSEENVLTLYSKPGDFGVVALLAHNYLNSGRVLAHLQPDQEIVLVYGDGNISRYRISSVQYFQAIDPHNNRSDFRDLNGPGGAVISYDQLFKQVYTQTNQLVFQTCLEANGDLSWGRIFISADPVG
jgi:hypothetical protein